MNIKEDVLEDDASSSTRWKCPHGCPQPFMKEEFLIAHMKRTHSSPIVNTDNQNKLELTHLKGEEVEALRVKHVYVKDDSSALRVIYDRWRSTLLWNLDHCTAVCVVCGVIIKENMIARHLTEVHDIECDGETSMSEMARNVETTLVKRSSSPETKMIRPLEPIEG